MSKDSDRLPLPLKFKDRALILGVEFNIAQQTYFSPEKDIFRTTAVFLQLPDGRFGVGTAVRSPEDAWDTLTGESIAVSRAFQNLVERNESFQKITGMPATQDFVQLVLIAAAEKAKLDTIEAKKRYLARLEANFQRKLENKKVLYGFIQRYSEAKAPVESCGLCEAFDQKALEKVASALAGAKRNIPIS